MKRLNGIWYYNACSFNMKNGMLIKTSHWIPAGTIERAIIMAGGHR